MTKRIDRVSDTALREMLAAADFVRWNGRGFTLGVGPPRWLLDAVQATGAPNKVVGAARRMRDEVHIGTRFGVMVARPGDWIVKYENGEIAVLDDFEFEMSGLRALSHPEKEANNGN